MAKASQEYSALRDRVVKEQQNTFRRGGARTTFIPADPGTWVDVALKGARGDGITDNYEKVQRVLDASIGRNIRFSNSSRGGTVYGTSQPWQIPGPMNIHIMGGAELKFIGQPAMSHTNTIGTLTSTMAALLYATGVDGLTIRNDGIIDGNGYHARYNPTGFTSTTGIVLQDCQHANVHIGHVQRTNAGCHMIDSSHCEVGHGYGAGYSVPAVFSAEGIHHCTIHDLHGLFTHEVFDFNGFCYENTVYNCYGVNCVDETYDLNCSPGNKFSNLWSIFYPEGYSNFRGAWATATSYADTTNDIGDIVTYAGSYYRPLTTHTSTALNGPGGVDSVWLRFGADALLLAGVGSGRFTSHPGFGGSDDNEFDGVYGNVSPNASDNFIAIQAGVVPIQETQFSCANNKFKNVHCWGGGRAFFIDIGGDFDPADTATAWGTGEAYAVNDIVEHNSLYWWALQAHTSAGANEPDTGGGDAFWRETVAIELTIDAVAGLEIEGRSEDTLREDIRFEGMAEFPSSGLNINGWKSLNATTHPRIYVENATQVRIANVEMPQILFSTVGIQLYNVVDAEVTDFYIAADATPYVTGNYGISIGGISSKLLIADGTLRNFTGPSSRGGIALVSDNNDDIEDVRISRVTFEGNRYAVWDDTLTKGISFIHDCTLIGNINSFRTPGSYNIQNISNDPVTWTDNTPATILAAATKTPPVDGDSLPLIDSAAGNVLKRLTWANLKAAIKAYYDSVVATLTNKSISGSTNTLTNIGNAALTNSGVTIGSTPVALGATAATVAGLTLTTPTINGLAADMDAGENIRILLEILRARDVEGLRIEDDGGILAIFVEDGGQVGIGTSAPGTKLDVVTDGAANTIRSLSYGTGFITNVGIYAPRGTEASPSANLTGDELGSVYFGGWDTALSNGARITAIASADWGTAGDTSDSPTDLVFYTVADGSGALTERLRISSAGLVTITGNIDVTGVVTVDGVQVVSNRVVDARADDVVGATWTATEQGVLDAVRDCLVSHGLIAAA